MRDKLYELLIKSCLKTNEGVSTLVSDVYRYVIIVFNVLSRVAVTYRWDFGLDDWICCDLYIHTTRDYRPYSDCCLRIRCRGTVFTESLPSSGYTRHNTPVGKPNILS
jgi:hypothetical protein